MNVRPQGRQPRVVEFKARKRRSPVPLSSAPVTSILFFALCLSPSVFLLLVVSASVSSLVCLSICLLVCLPVFLFFSRLSYSLSPSLSLSPSPFVCLSICLSACVVSARGPVDVVARVAAVSPVIRFKDASPFFMLELEQAEQEQERQAHHAFAYPSTGSNHLSAEPEPNWAADSSSNSNSKTKTSTSAEGSKLTHTGIADEREDCVHGTEGVKISVRGIGASVWNGAVGRVCISGPITGSWDQAGQRDDGLVLSRPSQISTELFHPKSSKYQPSLSPPVTSQIPTLLMPSRYKINIPVSHPVR